MDATLPFDETRSYSTRGPSAWSTRTPRLPGEIEVSVRTGRGERCFIARDLSLTGVYLAGVKASMGKVVPIQLRLPGEEETLELAGRVVRVDTAQPGVALAFSRIGWEDMFTIARFMAPRL